MPLPAITLISVAESRGIVRKVVTVLLAHTWPTLAHAQYPTKYRGPDNMARKTRQPGTFGAVETLPSGRLRARYRGPDGRRYTAPTLFLTKKDARGWLAIRHADIIKGQWMPPDAQDAPQHRLTFKAYADTWMAQRDLKDRTREH